MMSTTNGQASERNSDASAHYIDILDENIALPTLEGKTLKDSNKGRRERSITQILY